MSFFLFSSNIQSTGTNLSLTLELLLSILAIIISVFSVFFEYYWSQRINRTNLEADFFKDIYGDYLMKKIPAARTVFHYSNHILSDTDDLIEVLNDIRRSSLFYKYKDKKFYKKLCTLLQGLEDKLVQNTGITLDDEYYGLFVNEVNMELVF